MMKKPMMLAILSMILVFSLFGISRTGANPSPDTKPLRDLHLFLQKEELPLVKWELMMRRTIKWEGEQTLDQIGQTLHLNTLFKKTDQSKSVKYYAINSHKKIGLNEHVILIKEKGNSQPNVEIIYKMSGTRLNEAAINEINERLTNAKSQIFHGNTAIFTCLQSRTGANIKDNLLRSFVHSHNLDILHRIEEKDFFVVSGFTNQWDTHIPLLENKKMNVQFSVRKGLGGTTYVTIGTPILTVEY
ncbi:MAG: YwmB family TATA-box binding protein [Bacillaceae bacterium]|nr:YwmB family TATA-box binding protein [Bacillaceae bacterium]